MSVSITFEPSGISGLVAEGTYLIDAARRMGASLGTGCTAGKGDCPACLVTVKTGAGLLSVPSDLEERVLGAEQLEQAFRIACQVKIESPGEIVVSVSSQRARGNASRDSDSDLQKTFGSLTLEKKIATLLKLEAITMSEAFDTAIQKPLALGTRALDAVVARVRSDRNDRKTK